MSELDVWVGESGSQKTVHVVVVACYVQISPEHLDGVVFAGIDLFEVVFSGEDHIDDNVCISVRLLALVDHTEHVQVPYGAAIVVVRVVEGYGGEDARLCKLREHHLVQVVPRKHATFEKVGVGSLEDVSETDVDPAVLCVNVCKLGLQKVERGCIIVQATLDEESFGETAQPVLVEFGVGGILPKGDHSVSSGTLLPHLVIG